MYWACNFIEIQEVIMAYSEFSLVYYFAISIFCLAHWWLSFFFLKTSLQLKSWQKQRILVKDRTFVIINILGTILVLTLCVVGGLKKEMLLLQSSYDEKGDKIYFIDPDDVAFWQNMFTTAFFIAIFTFAIALIILRTIKELPLNRNWLVLNIFMLFLALSLLVVDAC